jgi:MFS family permease
VGVGELFVAGALPATVNELAPEALRGRYNAVLTMAITSGMWAGPLMTAAAGALGVLSSLFAAALALLLVAPMLVPGRGRSRREPASSGPPSSTTCPAAASSRPKAQTGPK